jgi:hypothetical protein
VDSSVTIITDSLPQISFTDLHIEMLTAGFDRNRIVCLDQSKVGDSRVFVGLDHHQVPGHGHAARLPLRLSGSTIKLVLWFTMVK